MKNSSWPRWLLALWIYTLLVILWGAWVRISHSGAGCGDHWPLCSGEIIPDLTNKKTLTEYLHRLMSGFYGIAVFFVFYRLRKSDNSQVRRLSHLLFFFTISEALLGALLVKGELVTVNDSVTRLIVMALHQINSFMLTGVSYLLYECHRAQWTELRINKTLTFLFLLLPVTGAIAALSTTLFPSVSLWQGILQDFSSENHLFVRLRIIHPALALGISFLFIYKSFQSQQSRLAYEFLLAVAVGVVTLLTLSPLYLKLAHLLIAHGLWARVLYTFVSRPDSKSR